MASKKSSERQNIKRIVQEVKREMPKKIPTLPQRKGQRVSAPSVAAAAMKPFGGVSEVGLAPVTIGNTIRAVKQTVVEQRNGVRVIGRDFVMAVGGTSSAYSNWTLQAGFGLSPICLNATGLRGYFQTYERFKWNAMNVHYITSSPTSATGDVLLMYHSNHGGPKVDHTSTNFMSYALSTDAALLGPQWTNHSVQIVYGERDWYDTDVLSSEDVKHQADGELLCYTRNTTQAGSPDQPGYLLIDYDVVFERRMLNPRVQSLPSSLFKWQQGNFTFANSTTAGQTVTFTFNSTFSYVGTILPLPAGIAIGDIFQVVFDTQVSSATGGTFATAFSITVSPGVTQIYPISTGTTLYAVCGSAVGIGAFALYPNYDAALVGTPMVWTSTIGALTLACPLVLTCVGSQTAVYAQANIG
jgi:hypothetical protein